MPIKSSRYKALMDSLEIQGFIYFHNYILDDKEKWLMYYKSYLEIRSYVRVLYEQKDNIYRFRFYYMILMRAKHEISSLKMFDLKMEEYGRRNPEIYEDNILRWSAESTFMPLMSYYEKTYDNIFELKSDIYKKICKLVLKTIVKVIEVEKANSCFWKQENLRDYAIQISDTQEYMQEVWRKEHFGYFYKEISDLA